MSSPFLTSAVGLYWAIIILCHLSVMKVVALPSGAPISACESMTPSHGMPPSTEACPFETFLNEVEIFSNESLILTIKSAEASSKTFQGFLVMGFDTQTDLVIGSFKIQPGQSISQTLDCYGKFDTAATHTKAEQKESVELEWIPPEDYEGEIIFKTTYVQSFQTYWVKQSSPTVKILRSVNGAYSSTVDPELSTEPVILPDVYEGCGSAKSCIATPDDCIPSGSCSMLTSFKRKDDYLEMEIYGKVSSNQYIAVGFSADDSMGTDSVTECVFYRDVPTSHQSFNYPEKDNQRQQSQPELRSIRSAFSQGYVYCQVEHPISYVINDINFNLSQSHYVLMATGPTSQSKISRHTSVEKTGEPVDFLSDQSFVSYTNINSRVLKQLHGSFMVAAWLIAASVGVMMPRYMKKSWMGQQFKGKDLWFVYHVLLMTTTWTLTVAGFIIIFVDIGGWVSESISENPHPLIGCITMALAFIQPFMAALRPLPTAPNRYIFNWAHMLVGYSAHTLAITCIFLAVEMEEAELPQETYGILGAHLVCYVAVHFLLTYLARKKTSEPGESLKDNYNADRQNAFVKKAILSTYALIVVCLGFTVIAFIAGASS